MIDRAYIGVDGPSSAGKTTFIERLLDRCRDELVLAVRVLSAGTKKQAAAKAAAETKRFMLAGAIGCSTFRHVPGDPDAYWESGVTENYSRAIVFEGELVDIVSADLSIHVMRPLTEGKSLLIKGPPGMRQADRENMAYMERVVFRGDPTKISALRELQRLLPSLGLEPRGSGWSIDPEHTRITSAAVVVINVHDKAERSAAERLAAEVRRLREDPEVMRDVLGFGAQRRQPTIVVANLADPKDTDVKKALARVKRTITKNSGQ